MAKEIVVRLNLSQATIEGLQDRGLSEEQVERVEEALANICVSLDVDTGKILEYHQDEHWNYN